jgi:uncharacterized protein YacL
MNSPIYIGWRIGELLIHLQSFVLTKTNSLSKVSIKTVLESVILYVQKLSLKAKPFRGLGDSIRLSILKCKEIQQQGILAYSNTFIWIF